MKQGVLPFQYEQEKTSTGITALAGLPPYLDLAQVVKMSRSIERHVRLREVGQGWTDSQMVISLLLLNLAGGESVDDLRILDKDAGLCRVLRRAESYARGLAVAGHQLESVRGIKQGPQAWLGAPLSVAMVSAQA